MNIIMIGATGAVGSQCLQQLIQSEKVEKITLLSRRRVEEITSLKVTQYLVDLQNLEKFAQLFEGASVAICTLGVGEPSKINKTEFIQIDHDIPLSFAKICKEKGIKHFELLSSVSVNPKSSSYYLKLKGQLNQKIAELEFERLSIFHPSMILTPQNRYGFSQAIVLKIWPKINPFLVGPLAKFKGIKVEALGQVIALNVIKENASKVEHLHFKEFMEIKKPDSQVNQVSIGE